MTRLHYEIVDVFTDRPFTGNPLAVVFGADGLATTQMQALALEFHLSETVFILPPTSELADYRVRIFTPRQELPFAGHPCVGAAAVQVRRGAVKVGELTQECDVGLLPIVVDDRGFARLTGGTPELGGSFDAGPLLAATGLSTDDLVGPPPGRAGCGLTFGYVRVRRDALARARVPAEAHDSVFAWDAATRTAYARVFVEVAGVPEDPATGSAALGMGVYLVSVGLLPGDGTSTYVIHQGHEMGRPSVLECTVTARDGVATGATVAGQVVEIASGEMVVPPFIG